ncbi:hypothetical protein VTI74DRAFT_8262 [Chaetomium olivicolor]
MVNGGQAAQRISCHPSTRGERRKAPSPRPPNRWYAAQDRAPGAQPDPAPSGCAEGMFVWEPSKGPTPLRMVVELPDVPRWNYYVTSRALSTDSCSINGRSWWECVVCIRRTKPSRNSTDDSEGRVVDPTVRYRFVWLVKEASRPGLAQADRSQPSLVPESGQSAREPGLENREEALSHRNLGANTTTGDCWPCRHVVRSHVDLSFIRVWNNVKENAIEEGSFWAAKDANGDEGSSAWQACLKWANPTKGVGCWKCTNRVSLDLCVAKIVATCPGDRPARPGGTIFRRRGRVGPSLPVPSRLCAALWCAALAPYLPDLTCPGVPCSPPPANLPGLSQRTQTSIFPGALSQVTGQSRSTKRRF